MLPASLPKLYEKKYSVFIRFTNTENIYVTHMNEYGLINRRLYNTIFTYYTEEEMKNRNTMKPVNALNGLECNHKELNNCEICIPELDIYFKSLGCEECCLLQGDDSKLYMPYINHMKGKIPRWLKMISYIMDKYYIRKKDENNGK